MKKETSLKVLNLLKNNPYLTQRDLHREMGVSLGVVNFCVKSLVEKGMIKVERFKKNKKAGYAYHLTPNGLDELAVLTLKFLKQKINEYDRIKHEIRQLSKQASELDPDLLGSDSLPDLPPDPDPDSTP